MQVQIPSLSKDKIKKTIDEIADLTKKKKELTKKYIEPVDEEIELLKTSILSEWKLDKSEKQFHGTKPTSAGEEIPHATISQAVKIEVNYKQIVIDNVGDPDNIEDIASKCGMTEEEFKTKYIKRTESKPSIRIYT